MTFQKKAEEIVRRQFEIRIFQENEMKAILHVWTPIIAQALEETWNEAVEEAAKVSDEFAKSAKSNSMYPAFNTNQMAVDGEAIAKRIRALRKPDKEKE